MRWHGSTWGTSLLARACVRQERMHLVVQPCVRALAVCRSSAVHVCATQPFTPTWVPRMRTRIQVYMLYTLYMLYMLYMCTAATACRAARDERDPIPFMRFAAAPQRRRTSPACHCSLCVVSSMASLGMMRQQLTLRLLPAGRMLLLPPAGVRIVRLPQHAMRRFSVGAPTACASAPLPYTEAHANWGRRIAGRGCVPLTLPATIRKSGSCCSAASCWRPALRSISCACRQRPCVCCGSSAHVWHARHVQHARAACRTCAPTAWTHTAKSSPTS